MTGRVLALVAILALGWWAASASYAGDGARHMYRSSSPASARSSLEREREVERLRAEREEQDRRYRAGQMSPAEAAAYAALLAREQAAQRERERQAYLRNVQRSRSGGSYSGGK